MRLVGYLAALAVLTPSVARADRVTPTAVTYTFTRIGIALNPNRENTLTSSEMTTTFSRSDGDFNGVTLTDVAIPYGRYFALNVCYKPAMQVLLDGVTNQGYGGPGGTGITHGQQLWTTDAGVTTANPGTATPYTFSQPTTVSEFCSTDVFASPLCLVDDQKDAESKCQAGDTIYTAEGKVVPANDAGGTTVEADATLQLYLLTDLYNSVDIDPTSLAINSVPGLQVTVGQPGAAIHLSVTDGQSETADVGFLFSADKKVIWSEYDTANDSAYPGMCGGQGNAYLTAEPPGFSWPLPQQFALGVFQPSVSGGEVITPVTGRCTNQSPGAQCGVDGDNVTTALLQSVDSEAQITCIPDSQGPFEGMGYQYPTGPQQGGDGSTVSLTIARIVDPLNILGTCTGNFVENHTGTCAMTGNAADGYPQ